MNLLSYAETVKGQEDTEQSHQTLCWTDFPCYVPKKGQQKESELLSLDGFFSLIFLQRLSSDKNCDTSSCVLHTTKVRQLGNWFYFLHEAVEIEIIRVKVQERLRGVAGPVRLQHGGAGGDDGGLARGVDGFELELRAHPQAAVRASVSHNFHLWEGEMGRD